ncbi:MAG: thioredoxin domain-containing protein, partial [Planctomycetota bacterium]
VEVVRESEEEPAPAEEPSTTTPSPEPLVAETTPPAAEAAPAPTTEKPADAKPSEIGWSADALVDEPVSVADESIANSEAADVTTAEATTANAEPANPAEVVEPAALTPVDPAMKSIATVDQLAVDQLTVDQPPPAPARTGPAGGTPQPAPAKRGTATAAVAAVSVSTPLPHVDTLSHDEAAPATSKSRSTTARRYNGSRPLSLLKGKLTIDAYDHPVIGSPEAEHLVVELMDYACPHCHEFADMLEQALPRYGDRLGVVVLPVPTELLCNKHIKKYRPRSRGDCKVSQVALALAEAHPDSFLRLHEWLLSRDRLPSWSSTLARAREMGGDRVEAAFISPQVKQRLQRNIAIYAQLARSGASSLPCQILGDTVVPGKPATVSELCRLWEQHLGVTPVN